MVDFLKQYDGFGWDVGNRDKNQRKHNVSTKECEETFSNRPIVVAAEVKHSVHEPRFFLLGRTAADRLLYVVFTVRGTSIRVISARDMNRNERGIYGQKTNH